MIRYFLATKKRKILTAGILFTFVLFAIYLHDNDSIFEVFPELYLNNFTAEQCVIPYYNPFDQSIMPFFRTIGPLVCPYFPDLVYLDSLGYYNYNQTAIKAAGFEGNVVCSYRDVERDGEYKVKLTSPKQFQDKTYIPSDNVQIECYNDKTLVYKKFFHNIDYQSTMKTEQFYNETDDHISVLIFGLDSVSKLSAYRKLPKTMKYLQEDLNAYVFKGYTKVAAYSFPNLYALLSGEFPRPKKYYEDKTIDDAPFIWKEFQSANYVTMYMEDRPFMSNFHSITRGFAKKPVHHYQRPFTVALKTINPYFKYKNYKDYVSFYKWLAIPEMCYTSEPTHQYQIKSFKRFLQSYKHKRKFALSWITSMAHGDPNYLQYGDEDFVKFLKFMKKEHFLEKAIFIFMGDHGSVYNPVRNTPIGRIEERMPIFAMVVPEILKMKFPKMDEILTRNTERLVTHLDVHETMIDVLTRSKVLPSTSKPTLGRTLFKEIPKTRSCKDAHIPDLDCPCYSRVPISKDSSKIQNIARVVVDRINTVLREVKHLCRELKLEQIENAELVKSKLKSYTDRKSLMQRIFRPSETKDEQYFLVLRTQPGNALFEAMVLYKDDRSIEITENIDRANRYGNQSHCVWQKRFKPYCYCIKS